MNRAPKWYLLRWVMYWGRLLSGIIGVLTFGTAVWADCVALRAEAALLDYAYADWIEE